MEIFLSALLLTDIALSIYVYRLVKRQLKQYQQRLNQQQREIDHLNENMKQVYLVLKDREIIYPMHNN
ncbi:hypothetical protein [Spirosoma endbachense]|uniref:Uncharacterized protein n=1 Tax=Spirosoma endbachense TaxID=2666025 RepID=A0A6P1VX23_9BACT|nr:hypothetical protein [Spirosoma endbachense]QHV96337.1 hypothetical protein GJR95_15495 [Spirosoma endbachense]